MKYDFLVKEKCNNSSNEPENISKNEDNTIIGSTMLSTYEDFNIFLKKTQDKKIDNKIINDNSNREKENKSIDGEIKNKQNTDDKHSIKKDNSTLFESEKKTVETIVKYSSSFLSLLLNFLYMLKNAFMHIISKKNQNNNSIKDKDIIDRFNKHYKKKDKHKHIEKNDKHVEKNDKYIIKNDKHIKKINSYLLELD